MSGTKKPAKGKASRRKQRAGEAKSARSKAKKLAGLLPVALVAVPARLGELQRRAQASSAGDIVLPFEVDEIIAHVEKKRGGVPVGAAEARIIERRTWSLRLLLQNHTVQEIAAQLSIHHATAYGDVQWILQEWRELRLEATTFYVVELIQRMMEVERQAWLGYDRSQQPSEETIHTSGLRDDKPVDVTVTRRKPARDGNPKFLAEVRGARELIARTLGLIGGRGDEVPTSAGENAPPVEVHIHYDEKEIKR